MNFYRVVLAVFLLFSGHFFTQAQLNLAASLIPDSLKKGAHSVVRESQTTYEYKSPTSGKLTVKYILTVLDEKGKDDANFRYYGDLSDKLTAFSGKMYDAEGKVLEKYNMSDMESSEWSTEMASDDKIYGFDIAPSTYPFTIQYEYEGFQKDAILSFPVFMPCSSFNQSVEKSSYKLIIPENLAYRVKAFHLDSIPGSSTAKGFSTHEWRLDRFKAIEEEPYDFELTHYIPYLYLNPMDFIYEGYAGNVTDWKALGKWDYALLEGRDVLPEELQTRILEMTKTARNDREKVKILYNFLGETTHYVSIQLGIGGLQPMPASEVYRCKFGDCKALSNFLKAMLRVAGIPSNYTSIYYGDRYKYFLKDYASWNQMNHVILQVPLPGDTLYLECTNPRNPFGFIHNGISGHDALLHTPEGGIVVRLPDYPDSLNIEKHSAKVTVAADGSARVQATKTWSVKAYDEHFDFSFLTKTKQLDYLGSGIHLPNATMGDLKVTEDKSFLPVTTVNYTWSTNSFGNVTGNRLFMPVNFTTGSFEQYNKKQRTHDFRLEFPSTDIDSILIELPKEFVVESIPASFEEKTPYGRFTSTVKQTDTGILVVQKMTLTSGTYLASEYPAFIAFLNKLSNTYKGKIILRKSTL